LTKKIREGTVENKRGAGRRQGFGDERLLTSSSPVRCLSYLPVVLTNASSSKAFFPKVA